MDPAFEWGITRVTPVRFEQIIDYLKSTGYESVSLDQIYKTPETLPQKPVAITFDDGYESVYQYAFPILEKYQFISTTFVITDYINQYNTWDVNLGGLRFKHLNWEQILEMKNHRHYFGSHSMSHRDLTSLPDQELMHELQVSKKVLEEKLNSPVHYISFPFGKYNQRVLDFSKQSGYFKGIGVSRPIVNKTAYVVDRKAFYWLDTFWNLNAKLQPSLGSAFEDLRLRLINLCSYGTTIVKRS